MTKLLCDNFQIQVAHKLVIVLGTQLHLQSHLRMQLMHHTISELDHKQEMWLTGAFVQQ